ncbi:hypothetical protein KY289_013797 [Solanum tuberosum]|nr:hypothetical protein KY289_013797 [Solanum tuberosum]
MRDNDEAIDNEDENEEWINEENVSHNEIHDMLEEIGAKSQANQETTSSNNGCDNLSESEAKKFEKLLKEAECELYPGCKKFSKLSFAVKLLHLKVYNQWSNKSFNMLLELLRDALPNGETLPKSHYDAKNMLQGLGLGYISIHACKYDCVLYWGEFKDRQECPQCGTSRWKIEKGKGKKIPHKVLRYFPLKPRLQRLFMSKKISTDMRWHKEAYLDETNVLRHPVDSEAWKEFDKNHTWFAQEPRNIRLGLATDGFNPFGNMSTNYSMTPVIIFPYNLPPWKCFTDPFMMMSLLIPGPQAPGKDIDVYLRPLVDELKELWSDGVETFDSSTGECFKMHAAVLWTINDFPAYANLSGCSTKGYMACPTCNKDALSQKVRSKICYIGHRRYLKPSHAWRRSMKFDGKTRFNREDRNADGSSNKEEHVLDIFSKSVRPFKGEYDAIPKKDFDMAQWYVLNNCEEAEPFLQEHKNELLNQDVVNIEEKHREHFSLWFKGKIMHLCNKENSMSIKKLYPLAMGPDVRGRRYPGCIVNGVRYHIQSHDELRKSQNSGIVVEGYHENEVIDFYGKNWRIVQKFQDRHIYDVLEMQNSKVESDELHTTDEVYQDVSMESNMIDVSIEDMPIQLHRDDIDSITLDSSAYELKVQTEHEVVYNTEDSDLEDDSIIEYISDLDRTEGTTRAYLSLTTTSASLLLLPVVGSGTTSIFDKAVQSSKQYLDVAFAPSKATGKVLALELPKNGNDKCTVLYPASAKASTDIEEGLSGRGFEVTRLNTYTTAPVNHVDQYLLELALSAPVVAVASSSALRVWANLTASRQWDNAVACIGETTASAAKKLGFRNIYYPTSPGLEG